MSFQFCHFYRPNDKFCRTLQSCVRVCTYHYFDENFCFYRCGYCIKPESFEFFAIYEGKHSDRVYFFLPSEGKLTPDNPAQPTTEEANMCGIKAEENWLYMLYE